MKSRGVKLRSVEDLNDREHGVRFDDFLCMDAFRMGIKSKDDLRRYSLEELEKMCPKDKRLVCKIKEVENNTRVILWDLLNKRKLRKI